jgi:deoxyribodipyrimidine photolyase-related protein
LFFKDKIYPVEFHREKLKLHKNSMKEYYNHLSNQGYNITYIDIKQVNKLKELKNHDIETYESFDFILELRLERDFTNITFKNNPGFINTTREISFRF